MHRPHTCFKWQNQGAHLHQDSWAKHASGQLFTSPLTGFWFPLKWTLKLFFVIESSIFFTIRSFWECTHLWKCKSANLPFKVLVKTSGCHLLRTKDETSPVSHWKPLLIQPKLSHHGTKSPRGKFLLWWVADSFSLLNFFSSGPKSNDSI